ncbi:MAG TPA: RodZ domain-containing protein [Candidatus Acidoferrales bacterium]|nr:RodZ domain-containing protein [Candidatus Acidoferrales bacterium]
MKKLKRAARASIDTERTPAYISSDTFKEDLMGTTSLFGEHLKREREMRGVSLEEISAATRISVRFLEALENEQWAQLPGGIFNRGFIRSIAKFLGMDEDGLVAEYALETQERPEIAVWTREPVKPRPNYIGIFGAILVIAAVIAGGWYVRRAYGERISAWHARHPIIATVMAKLKHKNAVNGALQAADSGAATTAMQAAQTNSQNGAAASGAAAIPVSGAASSSANDAGALVLKVEAGETSTVTVMADGKTIFSGKLDAMKTLTLHAEKSFTVSASKSNAVLLELNGRTVPPLGPPNEPGKITLTRENLKRNPGDGYY